MKNILKIIQKMISYQENHDRENFILRENKFDRQAMQSVRAGKPEGGVPDPGGTKEGGGEISGNSDQGGAGDGPRDNRGQDWGGNDLGEKKGQKRLPKKILRANTGKEPTQDIDEKKVQTRLDLNRVIIQRLYGLPQNKDIVIREFAMGSDPPLKGFILYMDGLVDRKTLNPLMQDLMVFTRMFRPESGPPASFILKNLLPGSQAKLMDSFEKITDAVNYGDTAFFFQDSTQAVLVETKGWESRSVDRPENEQTITGPQEAFVESLRTNTALIRKIIRSSDLYTEFLQVGARFPSDVAVMYIKDLANPDLVDEIKRRISSITVDFVTDTGILEQFIEDNPYNLNPQTMMTERPDRVAAALAEGRAAIILSGSPFALVVPVTMYSQMHTGEETYLRWQYGTFLRYIRTISFYLALLLPGSYLAVVLYHQEMIPTELLLAVAGNRERVPFPTVVEMLLMEFSFELVREAGLRIPGIIGSTIGIVGALILGQAAVQANIVSPILVILVAVTGLASFSIPSSSLAFAIRIYRFFHILMGALLGFYGITISLFVQILFTTNLKSFGVPYLSPTGPRTFSGSDVVNRLPIFLNRRRPDYLNPLDDVRMPGTPRGWVKGRDKGNERGSNR